MRTMEQFIITYFVEKLWCSKDKPKYPAKCFIVDDVVYMYARDREGVYMHHYIKDSKWVKEKRHTTFYVCRPVYINKREYYTNVKWDTVCAMWKKCKQWIPNK